MSILDYIFYFFFYSFIGWFFESCYCSLRPKKWVNRGFMRGPICPIYGTGALVILIALVPLRSLTDNLYINEAVIFVAGMILCDAVEFMTSLIMEKLFNARWWDYSDKKFNIQGRICLTHTLYWGTCSCLFIFVLHPIIDIYLVSQVSETSRSILTYIFLTVFAFDLLDTVINALGIRKFGIKLKAITDELHMLSDLVTTALGIDNNVDENITVREEIENKINELKEKYDFLIDDVTSSKAKTKKRLFNASPRMKETFINQAKAFEELLKDIKDTILK